MKSLGDIAPARTWAKISAAIVLSILFEFLGLSIFLSVVKNRSQPLPTWCWDQEPDDCNGDGPLSAHLLVVPGRGSTKNTGPSITKYP